MKKIISLLFLVFLLISCHTKTKYNVYFYLDDNLLYTISINEGEVLDKPKDPSKEGYTFVGWALDGKNYNFDFPVEENLYLNACFEVESYLVSFETYGGNLIESKELTYGTSTSTIYPYKIGHYFDGWYADESYTTKIDKIDSTTKVLHAKWTEEDNYTKDLEYELTENGYKLVGLGNNNNENIVIPYGVTEIDSNVFGSNANIKQVVIPETITEISYSTFSNCINLENVIFPNTLTKINDYAFKDCSNLKELNIPASVEYISEYAFHGCSSLETIKVDSNNNYYDSRNDCNALIDKKKSELILASNNTVIPNTIKKIGALAFFKLKELEEIFIPASINYIAPSSFYYCKKINTIIVDEMNEYYSSYNSNVIVDIRNNNLLLGCSNSIIPDSVERISSNAFSGNVDIVEVYIPKNVIDIAPQTFADCPNIVSIEVDRKNPIYESNDSNAIFLKETKELLVGCSSTIIPVGTMKIGSYAFSGCINMEEVSIPNSVTVIGNNAFSYCSNLKRIDLDDGLVAIGNEAFYACSSLEEIIIPDSVKELGDFSFAECTSMRKITLSDNIRIINIYTFALCSSLEEVELSSNLEKICSYAFYGCEKLRVIHIPFNTTSIEVRAFNYCTQLEKIYIPISMVKLSMYSFENCDKLTIYAEAESIPKEWNIGGIEVICGVLMN